MAEADRKNRLAILPDAGPKEAKLATKRKNSRMRVQYYPSTEYAGVRQEREKAQAEGNKALKNAQARATALAKALSAPPSFRT